MPRRLSSPPANSIETPADRLQFAVDELRQNVRVLMDIVDQLREDLSWLTRNGMPHQPLTVIVHRMPGITGEGSRRTLEFSMLESPDRDPTAETLSDDQVRAAVIDDIVQRLAEPLGELAQEQLNSLVSIIDHAHREVRQAIRRPPTMQREESTPRKSRRRQTKQQPTAPVVPAAPIEPPPPPGRLF